MRGGAPRHRGGGRAPVRPDRRRHPGAGQGGRGARRCRCPPPGATRIELRVLNFLFKSSRHSLDQIESLPRTHGHDMQSVAAAGVNLLHRHNENVAAAKAQTLTGSSLYISGTQSFGNGLRREGMVLSRSPQLHELDIHAAVFHRWWRVVPRLLRRPAARHRLPAKAAQTAASVRRPRPPQRAAAPLFDSRRAARAARQPLQRQLQAGVRAAAAQPMQMAALLAGETI